MTTDPMADAAAPAPSPAPAEPVLRPRSGLGRFTALGSGVGIEVREKDLAVSLVRVRPGQTGVLGAALVTDFRTRPAAEWGGELVAFLRKMGMIHVAATVLLPRREVIVRTVNLPGVSDRDLESAIRLQIDALHPFADEDVVWSHARIGRTPFILVGVARRQVVDQLSGVFAEAGVKVASFTFSAGAIWSALRVITTPPANFVCVHEAAGVLEIYGESEARPVYSASLPVSALTTAERAAALGRSELRLEPSTPATRLSSLLPRPALFPADYDPASAKFEDNILPYATAIAGACPWLGIEANLLPPELRKASSRVRLIPTFLLAGALLTLVALLALSNQWADSRYLALLQREIAKYEPEARRVDALDRNIAATRARSQALDDFKRRSKLDMDAIAEITKLVPPPGWVHNLDMDRQTAQFSGDTDQAAPLLERFDKSPLFERSEFVTPISKSGSSEVFRIRTQRTTPPVTPPSAASAAASAPAAPPAGAATPGAKK